MKSFAIVAVFCFVGASLALPQPSTFGLEQDLQDFLKLVPADKVMTVVAEYVASDPEVQKTIEYLTGKEFASIWGQITSNKEFRDFVKYLDDAGLHVVDLLNKIADILGLPKYVPQDFEGTFKTGGLNGLINDVIALLPKDKIKALFYEKLQTSPEFKALYDKLSSSDFEKIATFVKNSPEMSQAFDKLKQNGVDVNKFIEFVKKVFGWH